VDAPTALEAKPTLLKEVQERLGAARKDHIRLAIGFAVQYGGTDRSHHKMWVIDQMVRALTGCPMVGETAKNYKGQDYAYETQGKSQEYKDLIAATYEWEEGTPP